VTYTLVVYDVSVERVNKVRQFLKQYLNWIQNSVFEGEITIGGLAKVRQGLKERIDITQDSILIFTISNKDWLNKEVMGIEKNEVTSII